MSVVLLSATLLLIISIAATPTMAQSPWSSTIADQPRVVVNGLGYGGTVAESDGEPLLAPKLQKEVDEGRKQFAVARYREALSRFQQAYQAAPANPNVNFLAGLTWLALNDVGQADPYLARASSLAPRDFSIQLLDCNRHAKGCDQLEPQMYLPHLVLAGALLANRNFSESLKEAQQALRWGKNNANRAGFILAKALAGLGRNKEALWPLREFVQDCPSDPAVKDAQKLIRQFAE